MEAVGPPFVCRSEESVPLYEYQCLPNSHRFEVRHGVHENPVSACPECGGGVRRVIQPVGIVFKGPGFYATDSRAKPASTAKKDEKSTAEPATGESKPESKSDGASPSKPETSSSAKPETAAS
jgi:putative FmdB family regulatory protein